MESKPLRRVWDGVEHTHRNPSDEFPPTFRDYQVIVAELQSTQQAILDLSGSIIAMPSLQGDLKEARDMLGALQERIVGVEVPDQLISMCNTLDTKIQAVSEANQQLKAAFAVVGAQTSRLADKVDVLARKIDEEFAATNQQNAEARTRDRSMLQTQLDSMKVQLTDIQALLYGD